MHNIFSLWIRLLAWLNESDGGAEADTPLPFDADLPPYHPLCD